MVNRVKDKIYKKTKGTIFENINISLAKLSNLSGLIVAVYNFKEYYKEN